MISVKEHKVKSMERDVFAFGSGPGLEKCEARFGTEVAKKRVAARDKLHGFCTLNVVYFFLG